MVCRVLERSLGIRLNWNKRYITLAPVATVLRLAFKLHDPEAAQGAESWHLATSRDHARRGDRPSP